MSAETYPMVDHVTVLSHSHSRLAKRWLSDGSIEPYEDTKQYTVVSHPVASIGDLSALLTRLEGDSHAGVIRGTFRGETVAKKDPEYKAGLSRKIKANFDDVPHNWVLIEVDEFTPKADPLLQTEAAITEYITAALPSEFHDASYHWQLSNSAGHAKNAGKLKVHLWFWLAQKASSEDLKTWATARKIAADKSVLNVVQFHYTAAPIAAPGVVIPVRQRSGFVQGFFGDEVSIDFTRTPVLSGPTEYTADADDLLSLVSEGDRLGWTLDQGRSVLMALDANADRAYWVKCLAALHHEFSGDAAALEVAVDWSMTADNFASREDVEQRWASFGKYRGGDVAGGRWLLAQQRERQVHLKYDAVAQWKARIAETQDEFALREKVCPEIRLDFRLDDMGREALSQLLRQTFEGLGTKYPIAQCRTLLAEKRPEKARGDADVPPWLQGWTYVTDDDKFYRIDSEEWLTMQGFNASYNQEMPVNENGEVTTTASWQVLNNGRVERVTRGMYLPWAGPLFTSDGGIRCVNTYRPSSVPESVPALSPGGKAAVAAVMRHLRLICGGRESVVSTFVNWMAHNVQFPGVKVRWAPLIKGVEGDGKSLLGDLMAAVMGRSNVRNVSPKVLGTDFTGWAEGSCMVVLEEIKLTGHNRHDILNAVKPFITNGHVEVHRKGQDGYDIVNTTNYIAFTNFADALPLTDTDRRWWIVFTPFTTIEQLAAAIGAGDARSVLGAYFSSLVGMIQKYPAELRRWLLDHQIDADFKPNSAAPMTEEKAVMIGMGVSEEESAVREILEKGGVGISTKIFASSYVMGELLTSGSDVSLATSAWSRLLMRMGYTRSPKKLKWRGKTENVWVLGHKHLEPSELRKTLDETVVDDLFADVPTAKSSEIDDIF